MIVVDASVGVKWFVPEVHAAEARQWRAVANLHTLSVFFDIEIANVVWKKLQRGELNRAEADAILAALPALPLARQAEMPLIAEAFDLAAQSGRTVYDCLYLALASQLGGKVVTADQRLYNSLAASAWASLVVWVGDVPMPP